MPARPAPGGRLQRYWAAIVLAAPPLHMDIAARLPVSCSIHAIHFLYAGICFHGSDFIH